MGTGDVTRFVQLGRGWYSLDRVEGSPSVPRYRGGVANQVPALDNHRNRLIRALLRIASAGEKVRRGLSRPESPVASRTIGIAAVGRVAAV
jgi:hypothetical protein